MHVYFICCRGSFYGDFWHNCLRTGGRATIAARGDLSLHGFFGLLPHYRAKYKGSGVWSSSANILKWLDRVLAEFTLDYILFL